MTNLLTKLRNSNAKRYRLHFVDSLVVVNCNSQSAASKVIIANSRGGRFLLKISEIWVGFGPVGNNEKKMGTDYEQLLRAFFLCFQGKKSKFL